MSIFVQPAFVEFLVFPWEESKEKAAAPRLSQSLQRDKTSGTTSTSGSEVLDALWIYLTKAKALIHRCSPMLGQG